MFSVAILGMGVGDESENTVIYPENQRLLARAREIITNKPGFAPKSGASNLVKG